MRPYKNTEFPYIQLSVLITNVFDSLLINLCWGYCKEKLSQPLCWDEYQIIKKQSEPKGHKCKANQGTGANQIYLMLVFFYLPQTFLLTKYL